MTPIIFNGEELYLHAEGLVIWLKHKMAIVADLHFEKASWLGAQSGQFLPPYDTLETLTRLIEVLEFCAVEKLVLLGDTVHDANAFSRMHPDLKARFEILCKRYKVYWILGNHEKGYVPDNLYAHDAYSLDDLIMRHEADDISHGRAEISGHYHPKAYLKIRGRKISRPCFIFNHNRLILPSFGTLTGGLNIRDQAFEPLIGKAFQIGIPIKGRVMIMSSDRL